MKKGDASMPQGGAVCLLDLQEASGPQGHGVAFLDAQDAPGSPAEASGQDLQAQGAYTRQAAAADAALATGFSARSIEGTSSSAVAGRYPGSDEEVSAPAAICLSRGEIVSTLLDEVLRSPTDRAVYLNYCSKWTGNRDDADDVFQRACVSVLRKADVYDGRGNFRAWVMAWVRYELMSWSGKNSRRRTVSLDAILSNDDDGSSFEDFFAGHDLLPERILIRDEIVSGVRSELAELNVVNRDSVLSFYFEGRDYKDIASQDGVPVKTIDSRLQRAKRRLRESRLLKRLSD